MQAINWVKNIVAEPTFNLKEAVPYMFCIFLAFMLLNKCEQEKEYQQEIQRIQNNNVALLDTIRNYMDSDGLYAADIRALNLKLDELGDSIAVDRSQPPVTITSQTTEIRETIEVPAFIYDTVTIVNTDTFYKQIYVERTDTFGKSNRFIEVTIPTDGVVVADAIINLEQDIWVENRIEQNNKTGEVFFKMRTDYPGVTFNNASAILVDPKQLVKVRKSFGVGFQTGIGITTTGQTRHYIGVGIHYSPKFLQW